MNKPTRFPEEFRIEAVKQVTERGHRVAEVAARLDVSQHTVSSQWVLCLAADTHVRTRLGRPACLGAYQAVLTGERHGVRVKQDHL